jgi:hypothetical protein
MRSVNTWLTARGIANVPAAWTWAQLLRRVDARWTHSNYALHDDDDVAIETVEKMT